jgi:hypothetical protein
VVVIEHDELHGGKARVERLFSIHHLGVAAR